jgi:uncharacterized protein
MTSATGAARRNTEAEIDAFADVCERLGGFDSELTMWYVDGWLTVLACGPARLPADEWLLLAFDDSFDRAFADPEDRARALAALETRLAVLHDELDAELLLQAPRSLRLNPLFDDWTDEDRAEMARQEGIDPEVAASLLPGVLWADGALAALDDLGPRWQIPPGDEATLAQLEELTDQIELLVHAPNSDDYKRLVGEYHPSEEPTRDDLLAEAGFAVQDLRLLLLDFSPKPPTRRVGAQPGRNDPCPCGSGKKYKKCHGALA